MQNNLEGRTRAFAVDVIRFVETLEGKSSSLIARQLIRSATSIGANYREAVRAESHDDFVHKLNISSKEAAETEYWLEILNDLRGSPDAARLRQESNELLRILTASVKTARTSQLQNS